MLPRRALFALRRTMATSASSRTPMEDLIRSSLTANLDPAPTTLTIRNDSASHAHHKAMRTQSDAPEVDRETHFHVTVVSDAFKGKMQPARHRMIYALLKEDMAREGGIHALQLVTRTTEEAERVNAKG